LSDPLDVPYLLNWQLEDEKKPAVQKQLFIELNDDEKVIYNYLKANGKEILDVIALECNIPTYKLAGILLNMELKEVIRPLPGKQFEII
jgi:DNA processing protein